MKIKIEKLIKKKNEQYNTNSISIKSGNAWFNCWENGVTRYWNEGETVEVADNFVVRKDDYKGMATYKISFPQAGGNYSNSKTSNSTSSASNQDINKLQTTLDKILTILVQLDNKIELISKHLNGNVSHTLTQQNDDLPPSGINEYQYTDDDIPF